MSDTVAGFGQGESEGATTRLPGEQVFAPPEGWSRLRLDVQWDGRDFLGWQAQAHGRTVQDELHSALSHFAVAARPVAAGRTDAGVHALSMPVHVDVRDGTLLPSPERLAPALNSRLGRDLAVLESGVAPVNFHARFACRSRSYVYRIVRAQQRWPLEEGRALRVGVPLDVTAMREAAAELVGRHDFAAFATREERQTVRELQRLEVEEHGVLLEVHVTGQSFLRHMVRALVGTLLLAGQGRLDAVDVREVLRSGDRARAGKNVPAEGLYFVGAEY